MKQAGFSVGLFSYIRSMNEHVQRIEQLLSIATVERIILDNDVKKTFIELHEEVFKTSAGCDGCPSEIVTALNRMKQFVKRYTQTDGMNTSNKYQLHTNTQLYFNKLNVVLTNDNISDDVARELLKEHKNMIKHFATFPEDWEKDIQVVSEKRKKSAKVEVNEEIVVTVQEEVATVDASSSKVDGKKSKK